MSQDAFDAIRDLENMLGKEEFADVLSWQADIINAKYLLEEFGNSIALKELRRLARATGDAATLKLKTVDPTQVGRIAQLQSLSVIPDLFDKLIIITQDRLKTAADNVEAACDNLD